MKNNEEMGLQKLDTKGNEVMRISDVPVPLGSYDPRRSLLLHQIACKLFQSGLFPNAKSEAGAFAIVEYGDELGLPPMVALQNIYNIKGHLSTGAQLMLALAMRVGVEYNILESTEEVCRISFKRGSKEHEAKFAFSEAKKMGLVREDSRWLCDPATQCFYRAASRGVRKIAPDAVTGLLLDDEAREIASDTPTNEAANGLKEALKKRAEDETAKAEADLKKATETNQEGKIPQARGNGKADTTPREEEAKIAPPKVEKPEAPKAETPTTDPAAQEVLQKVYALNRKAGLPKNEVLSAMQEIVPMASSIDDLGKWGADELYKLQGSLTAIAEGKKKVKAPATPSKDEEELSFLS